MAKLTRNTAGAAVSAARLEARDKYVYRALLDRADNLSADDCTLAIPEKMQPHGQHDTRIFGVSRRNVQRALAHLKLHGWVTWVHKPQGSEGRPPCHYTLLVGRDCDCTPLVKRQDDAQLGPSKAPGKAPETHLVKRQRKAPNPRSEAVFPEGQKKGAAGRKVPGAEALADCAVCGTPMDPLLPQLGYRTHPCCDPTEKPDRSTDLSHRRAA